VWTPQSITLQFVHSCSCLWNGNHVQNPLLGTWRRQRTITHLGPSWRGNPNLALALLQGSLATAGRQVSEVKKSSTISGFWNRKLTVPEHRIAIGSAQFKCVVLCLVQQGRLKLSAIVMSYLKVTWTSLHLPPSPPANIAVPRTKWIEV
jgi:hypothetical protein